MPVKKEKQPDEQATQATPEPEVTAANEPGERTQVVSDPDADPGPGDNPTDSQSTGELPKQPDYTGPGTYVARSERLDWPEGHVCYLGEYSVREFTADDFKGAGVEDQPTTRWEASNQYAIPVEAFTDAALSLVRQTGEFKIT